MDTQQSTGPGVGGNIVPLHRASELLVPRYLRNLNVAAASYGLETSIRSGAGLFHPDLEANRSALLLEWRGTRNQLRALPCVLPSWSIPLERRRLNTRWGTEGYVELVGDEVLYTIDAGAVPDSISFSDDVEISQWPTYTAYHGAVAGLIAAGIDAKRVGSGGARCVTGPWPCPNDGYPNCKPVRAWSRTRQPDGLIVYRQETEAHLRERLDKWEAKRADRAKKHEKLTGELERAQRQQLRATPQDCRELLRLQLARFDGYAVGTVETMCERSSEHRYGISACDEARIREIIRRLHSDLSAAIERAEIRALNQPTLRLVVSH